MERARRPHPNLSMVRLLLIIAAVLPSAIFRNAKV
jgi:hypothetical protein